MLDELIAFNIRLAAVILFLIRNLTEVDNADELLTLDDVVKADILRVLEDIVHDHEDSRAPHAGIAVIMQPCILWQGFVELQELVDIGIIRAEMILQRQAEVIGTMLLDHLFLGADFIVVNIDRGKNYILLIIEAVDGFYRAALERCKLLFFQRDDDIFCASIIAPIVVSEPANSRAIEVAMRFSAQIHIVELRWFYRHFLKDCFQLFFGKAAGGRYIHRVHALTGRHDTGLRHTDVLVAAHAEVARQLINVSTVNLQRKFRRVLDNSRSLCLSGDLLHDSSWSLGSP